MNAILHHGRFEKKRCLRVFLAAWLSLVFLAVCLFQSCGLAPAFLVPPPQIDSLEGHASIKISGEQGSGRAKFSFLFNLPHQGKISVSDPLSRTLYQIIVDENDAVLIVPSKRVYWQGEEDEVIKNVMGFRLSLYEMIGLITGRWQERGREEEDRWSFKRNEEGRILSGQKGELQFEVKEFFAGTSFARRVMFEHPQNKGSLKILSIHFNQPVNKGSFSLSFLQKYERKTWDEIEKILAHEN